MKTPEPYVGKWRITHMDAWDQDFVDLATPGYVKIQKNGSGAFQFGAVQGEMDCRVEKIADHSMLGFTWDGSDECDQASGRGWVRVSGKQMEGHIFFHLGEDSRFTAEKIHNTGRAQQNGRSSHAGFNMLRNHTESPTNTMMFYPRRKNVGWLSMACLAFSMSAAYIAARNGSVTMAVCACAAFLLFVFLFGPVLRNQTIEIGNAFLVVRTFRRAVILKAENLVEVVKHQNGSLGYRFHAGGILYYQVSPHVYYHAESLQNHFDHLFDLNKLGVNILEPGKQR